MLRESSVGIPSGPASYAGPPPSDDIDSLLWAEFAAAETIEGFCRSWLAVQCRQLSDIVSGLVLLGPANRGPFKPVAIWPDAQRSMKHLAPAVERSLAERRGLILPVDSASEGGAPSTCAVTYPLEVDDVLFGAVVLETPAAAQAQQNIVRQLHWGCGWLVNTLMREGVRSRDSVRQRLQVALEVVALAASENRFQAAAMAFITAIATRLRCDRVSLGLIKRGRARVKAVSHSVQLKSRTNLLRMIEVAMDEALDQGMSIRYPAGDVPMIVRHHAELARQHGVAVCTVPLMQGGAALGALTLERAADMPFDEETVLLCEAVAGLAGPLLELHRRDDQWIGKKAVEAASRQCGRLFGPGHLVLKLVTGTVLALMIFFAVAKGDYRVAAKTILEPAVKQAAVAPFNGYIRQAPARAGDVVRDGQMLCLLDDRDLRLERAKSFSKHEELLKQYRQAMAELKSADVEILTAQIDQVEAELALLDDQLARTRVVAPFDGIVVSGDLSQSLGAPVERGQVLYEVAPLEAYRVVLKVDERDVADIKLQQSGTLVLSAFPNDSYAFHVVKLTPVSTAKEGRNFFRMEAKLVHHDRRLRPGMEGVGKIDVDRRLLIWIWTHDIIDSIRLAIWTWLP